MEKQSIINNRYPHTIRVVRILQESESEEDPFECKESKVTLYEGMGRSYTDTTTEGDNNVDRNKRKTSIPVRYDEWDADRRPLDGDTIVSTVGNNVEIGIVSDCEPDNNRTVIYWNFTRV